MIVSKLKLEFSAAPWAGARTINEATQRLFTRVVEKKKIEAPQHGDMERMSMGELLYFALMGEGAKV